VGFLDALTTLGADGHEALVTFGNRFAFSEGAAACRELLAKGVGFSAIVAGNDLMALGCIQTLAQAGLRCPDDVSVIGVNDMPFADLVTPPLTTVRLSGYEMGAAAAAMLLERLENPGARARRELLPTELIVRESTGPPSSRRTRHPRRRS
jgi:LacI family transcriptional regulator